MNEIKVYYILLFSELRIVITYFQFFIKHFAKLFFPYTNNLTPKHLKNSNTKTTHFKILIPITKHLKIHLLLIEFLRSELIVCLQALRFFLIFLIKKNYYVRRIILFRIPNTSIKLAIKGHYEHLNQLTINILNMLTATKKF